MAGNSNYLKIWHSGSSYFSTLWRKYVINWNFEHLPISTRLSFNSKKIIIYFSTWKNLRGWGSRQLLQRAPTIKMAYIYLDPFLEKCWKFLVNKFVKEVSFLKEQRWLGRGFKSTKKFFGTIGNTSLYTRTL